MKERPILFSGEMVRAILDGRKTQTRRIVKPQPEPIGNSAYGGTRQGWKWKPENLNRSWNDDDANPYAINSNVMATLALGMSPYGQPGDRLWVRETWALKDSGSDDSPNAIYAADGYGNVKWRPSIHMPRWASRITLEITSVRVERLQDISEEDAKAEGIKEDGYGFFRNYLGGEVVGVGSPRLSFYSLWESINGPGSWDANPWVWVVEFKRIAP